MASIILDKLRHSYDKPSVSPAERTYALKQVSLTWENGGAYALLGPSGCGKTTMLNIISGLLTPTEGKILFDEQDVTRATPERRNIAQVFQFPVVYDTMTVYDNLAFPLRNRRIGAVEVARRVEATLEMLDMKSVARQRASGLGADMKQKISLGRGMVRSDVNAILFDEPLTVIDPQLKWQLRSQLKQLHRQFSHTLVYVTHDQTEALTFADKVVVMYDGEVVQAGTPEQLFDAPAHTFVGYFIGSPGMNVLPAMVDGSTATVGSQAIALNQQIGEMQAGAKVELGVRPEHVQISREGMPVQIERVEDIGRSKIVRGLFEGHKIAAIIGAADELPSEPKVRFVPEAISIYADSWRVAQAD